MTPNERIRSLKKQLNKERRTNRLLRKRLKEHADISNFEKDVPESFLSRANEASLFSHERYMGYLAAVFRRKSAYRLWQKYVGYFRRVRLVSVILRILSYAFLLLQTGTVFVIVLLLLLIALPLLAVITLAAYLIALLLMRRDNQKISHLQKATKIYVFFPKRTDEFSRGKFWKENILSFTEDPNVSVVVVSPYFFLGKGIYENGKYYFNFRRESDNLYFVRKHYFFTLRRHVLSRCHGRVSLIY